VLLAATFTVWKWKAQPGGGPPVAVSLMAMRGATGSPAPAGRVLLLTPDVTGLAESAAYRIEVVNGAGSALLGAEARGPQPTAKAGPLESGTYYVRLYDLSGRILREYGLTVR
jgi:hypothetical protein